MSASHKHRAGLLRSPRLRYLALGAMLAALVIADRVRADPARPPARTWQVEACLDWQDHVRFVAMHMNRSGALPDLEVVAIEDAIAALGARCTPESAGETTRRFSRLLDVLLDTDAAP